MKTNTCKTKVVFSGGFHNSPAIKIHLNIPFAALRDYADKKVGAKDLIGEYATDYQRKRLEDHFCGIKGCTCGSWHRADIDTTWMDDDAYSAKAIEEMGNMLPFPHK